MREKIDKTIREITLLFLPEVSEGSWNFTHRNDKIKDLIISTLIESLPIDKILECCQKIREIEDRKMKIDSENGKVYDPAVISWTQHIQSYCQEVINLLRGTK